MQAFIILITLSSDPAQGTYMWSAIKSFAQQDAKWHVDSTQQENSWTPLKSVCLLQSHIPIFLRYKVSSAGRCLAESIFQEQVQKESAWLRYTPSVSRQKDCLSLASMSDKHTNRKGLLPACALSQCDFCISKA